VRPEDEFGYVSAVKGRIASVEMDDAEACEACSARARCFRPGDGTRVIEAEDPFGVTANQRVRIRWDERGRFKATLIVYALPLAGLILGAWGGDQLAQRTGQSTLHDLWAAGLGFLGLVLSFILIRFFNARLEGRPGYLPTIVEVVAQESSAMNGRKTASRGVSPRSVPNS